MFVEGRAELIATGGVEREKKKKLGPCNRRTAISWASAWLFLAVYDAIVQATTRVCWLDACGGFCWGGCGTCIFYVLRCLNTNVSSAISLRAQGTAYRNRGMGIISEESCIGHTAVLWADTIFGGAVDNAVIQASAPGGGLWSGKSDPGWLKGRDRAFVLGV